MSDSAAPESLIPEGAACAKGHGCYFCHRELARQQDAEGRKDAAGPILVFFGLWLGGFMLVLYLLPTLVDGYPSYSERSMIPGLPSVGWTLFFCGALLQTLTIGGIVQIFERRREKRKGPRRLPRVLTG